MFKSLRRIIQTHPTSLLFKVISLVTSKLKNIFKDPFSSEEISLFHFNNYLLSAYYVLGSTLWSKETIYRHMVK